MGNPYEFRELMKAAFGYSDKSPDEVLAEQKRKRDDDRPAKRGRPAAVNTSAVPKASEVAKMRALLAAGKPRPAVLEE